MDRIEEQTYEGQRIETNEVGETKIDDEAISAVAASQISEESGIEDIVDEEASETQREVTFAAYNREPKGDVTFRTYDTEEESLRGDVEPCPSVASENDDAGDERRDGTVSRVDIVTRDRIMGEADGIQAGDIMSHNKITRTADTMLKLFKAYPGVYSNTRQAWDLNKLETANELTLGVPRKIRLAKGRAQRKQLGQELLDEAEIVGKSVLLSCRFCNCVPMPEQQRDKNVCFPVNIKRDYVDKNFPLRKMYSKKQLQWSMECECRLDPCRSPGFGPGLSITGTQLPLFDRESIPL